MIKLKEKTIFYFTVIALLSISCDHIYKEYNKESFATLSWKEGQTVSFYPEVEDVAKTYELILGVRHLYGARIKRLDVSIKIISPSGKETTKQYGFDLVNEKGDYLASCAGNMCDLETVVDADLKFSEPGKHQVVITPQTGVGIVRGIMEFGLIIDKKD